MLSHLIDVSIRSLIFAALAAGLPWILRIRRTAALGHAVWTTVLCGMLALLAFGTALPRLPLRIPGDTPRVAPAPQPLTIFIPPALPEVSRPATPPPTTQNVIDWFAIGDWSHIALYAYAIVALTFLVRFLTGIMLARRLLVRSTVVDGFRESGVIAVPLTVGWLRPEILLPLDWREWDRAKLDAVLAHEGAHVRRRDGMVAALAGLNRCIFWFHPLAWWLERRLALLAELACDESCVAELGDRTQYARLLLEMACVVDRSQGRLRQHALTMAASSHIRQRIDSLLQEGRTFSRGLTWAGWTALALCAVPVMLCAGTVTLDHETPVPRLFEHPAFVAPAPPPRPLLAQTQASPPSQRESPLKFDVASIRPAAPSGPPPPGTAAGSGGNAPPPPPPPPGTASGCFGKRNVNGARVDWDCVSLTDLLLEVFAIPRSKLVGPDWMGAQQFDISAKLPEGAGRDQVPEMFQALLKDRFGLAFHREGRDASVNALVVAKGGLKMKPAAQGSDQPTWVAAAAASAGGPYGDGHIGGVWFRSISVPGPDGAPVVILHNPVMGFVRRWTTGGPGGIIHYEAPNISLEGLAALAVMGGNGLDPGVVDMTGLTGRYQVTLDISMTDLITMITAGAHDEGAMQSAQRSVVQDGLKKLGLQLESRKTTVETIVVDHLERNPTPN